MSNTPRVLVVCARQYNGHELWTALGVMQHEGLGFEVISSAYNIADEVTGQPNTIDRIIPEVEADEIGTKFDALMIVSGNMADTEAYWKDKRVLSYVDAAHEQNLPIAAICCSVPTIRYAARDKRVSFFPLIRSRLLLEECGAILQTVACSVDDKLVTAEHQMATQMWAGAFTDVIHGRPHSVNLVDSGYMPKGRPRKPIPEVERLKGFDLSEVYTPPGVSEVGVLDFAMRQQAQGKTIKVHSHAKGQPCVEGCQVLNGNSE